MARAAVAMLGSVALGLLLVVGMVNLVLGQA